MTKINKRTNIGASEKYLMLCVGVVNFKLRSSISTHKKKKNTKLSYIYKSIDKFVKKENTKVLIKVQIIYSIPHL